MTLDHWHIRFDFRPLIGLCSMCHGRVYADEVSLRVGRRLYCWRCFDPDPVEFGVESEEAASC